MGCLKLPSLQSFVRTAQTKITGNQERQEYSFSPLGAEAEVGGDGTKKAGSIFRVAALGTEGSRGNCPPPRGPEQREQEWHHQGRLDHKRTAQGGGCAEAENSRGWGKANWQDCLTVDKQLGRGRAGPLVGVDGG